MNFTKLKNQTSSFYFVFFSGVILAVGLALRLYFVSKYQTRICIDEIWYILNPAYKLAFGMGAVIDDPAQNGMRGFLWPSLLSLYLKGLSFVGLTNGVFVLTAVRFLFTVFLASGFFVYLKLLKKEFALQFPPFLAVLVLFLNPEFIHFGATAELNVLAFPLLITGFYLFLETSNQATADTKTYLAWFLLFATALLRVQYGLALGFVLTLMLYQRQFKKVLQFIVLGILVVLLDVAFESYMYGHTIFPMWNYLHAHLFQKLADSYGVLPFGVSFEFLWRLMSEPVFAAAVLTLPLSYRRAPKLTAFTVLLFFVHSISGHKEMRFFFGPAVLFSGLAAASLQSWLEEKIQNAPGHLPRTVAAGFAVLVCVFFFWRGQKKVAWSEFSIPGKLETLAGTQPDAKGLVTLGWGGTHHGGNYTFYNKGPYILAEDLAQLKSFSLDAAQFNYVVSSANHDFLCRTKVAEQDGAILYRCEIQEMVALFEK